MFPSIALKKIRFGNENKCPRIMILGIEVKVVVLVKLMIIMNALGLEFEVKCMPKEVRVLGLYVGVYV